jgi:hypothetical protein
MNAREKLNVAHFAGAVIIAGIAASVIGSWIVFWIVLILLIAIQLDQGDIRAAKKIGE